MNRWGWIVAHGALAVTVGGVWLACSSGGGSSSSAGGGGSSSSSGGSGSCGGRGASCCNGAACDANLTCVSGTCSCGGSEQSCCDGQSCQGALTCASGKCANTPACGGVGQPCCASGSACGNGSTCSGSACTACGGAGQSCCSLATSGCDAGYVCQVASNQCQPCGGPSQACCPGDQCSGGLGCIAGTCGSTTAKLYVYYCPDYLSQGCSQPQYYGFDNMCPAVPSGSFQVGQWFDSGITVNAGQSYAISNCAQIGATGICGSCGTGVPFTTPSIFPSTTYGNAYWECNHSVCTPPSFP